MGKGKTDGVTLPNLIYYCSILTRNSHTKIAEYINGGDKELPQIALKCLNFLPPHHDKFSFTANTRTLACIIEDRFLYCAITDEALSRSKVMGFLDDVRHEFHLNAEASRKFSNMMDQNKIKTHCLDREFKPIFKSLITPFVGVPQREKIRIEEESRARARAEAQEAQQIQLALEAQQTQQTHQSHDHDDLEVGLQSYLQQSSHEYENYNPSPPDKSPPGSASPSRPLIGKEGNCKHPKQKQNRKKSKVATRDIGIVAINVADNKEKGNSDHHQDNDDDGINDYNDDDDDCVNIMRGEVSNRQVPTSLSIRKFGSMNSRCEQPVMAQRACSRNLKLILLFDVIACMILFAVWLGVCQGLSCTQG